jgi:hypothetical protein
MAVTAPASRTRRRGGTAGGHRRRPTHAASVAAVLGRGHLQRQFPRAGENRCPLCVERPTPCGRFCSRRRHVNSVEPTAAIVSSPSRVDLRAERCVHEGAGLELLGGVVDHARPVDYPTCQQAPLQRVPIRNRFIACLTRSWPRLPQAFEESSGLSRPLSQMRHRARGARYGVRARASAVAFATPCMRDNKATAGSRRTAPEGDSDAETTCGPTEESVWSRPGDFCAPRSCFTARVGVHRAGLSSLSARWWRRS